MSGARRLYLYVMAFAGLLAVLIALDGLASLFLRQLLPGEGSLLSIADTRQRASFYLAALIVGLPVWLGHWLPANRAAQRLMEERRSVQRRLFLAAVFAVTAVVALHALRRELSFLLTLPLPPGLRPTGVVGMEAAVRLTVFGAAWLACLRLAARDRASAETPTADQLGDVAFFVVTGYSLAFLLIGVIRLMSQATAQLLRFLEAGQGVLLNPGGFTLALWGASAAWLLAGGLFWLPLAAYDRRRAQRLKWRVVYLYLVLVIAVPATLGAAIRLGYELLRLGFGYRPEHGMWDFLQMGLAVTLAGAATWLYHWRALKDQAVFAVEDPAAIFLWPRRPAITLLALAGLLTAAPAFGSLLWVGFDWAFQSGSLLSGQDWWRDRTSLSLAGAIIGGAVWFRAWLMMQRAAAMSAAERETRARRAAITLAILAGGATALGFVIAALWLTFQLMLGEPLTPVRQSLLIKELSGMLVAGGVALYHGLVLRADGGLRRGPVQRGQLMVLFAPGSDAAVMELRHMRGIQIQVIGRLAGEPPVESDLPALWQRIEALGSNGEAGRALLILGAGGGSLYPLLS